MGSLYFDQCLYMNKSLNIRLGLNRLIWIRFTISFWWNELSMEKQKSQVLLKYLQLCFNDVQKSYGFLNNMRVSI